MQTRKLIAHGPSSLTVALPHKWVKKYNLHKGNEVVINEEDKSLRISSTPSERTKTINIDLTKHDWPAIVAVLTTTYRRGYDEIRVNYETPEEYQSIANAIHSLLGYAVMENRKGKCLIKSLPSTIEQDFPTLLRRVFLILMQQIDDLAEILDSPDAIKNFYHRDADLNALVNLAIRMINKGFVAEQFEELHLFHTLLMLEEAGDDAVKFTIEIQNIKDAKKMKQAVQNCSKMLRLLYDAYFQKKIGITEFYKQYYLYWPDAKKMPTPVYNFFSKTKGQPTFYLRSIVEKTIHLAEILLLPEVSKDF